MLSSSGYHSDGVACVALEVSESGLSCCWVTELQGGLTTSFRMEGHSGGVEAVGSCNGSELVHCHATLTLEAFISQVVDISGSGRGWGGTVVHIYNKLPYERQVHIPLAGRETVLETLLLPVLILPPSTYTKMVYSVLHWRLDKVALVDVLSTVYIIQEPPSGRYSTLTI